jgi:16S rRNA (uracil1498-N3)-methyltransferase
MTERYFSETPLTLGRATLAGPEAHHLIHVMRARPGSEVTLLDGSGAEFPCCVEKVGRSEAELQVLRRVEVDRELPFQVVLGVALPKGDRQRWLVEKATELGCAKLVPLRTERSVAEPTAGARKRLHRAVIEACKQCGRNRLMEIAPAADWPAFLASPSPQAWRLLAHPAAPSGERNRQADAPRAENLPRPQPGDELVLAVGPEGGFTEAEIEAALAAEWRRVDLGPRILRVETAAVALLAGVCS